VRYEAIDIWQDPNAREFVRSVANGDETVPTVRLGQEVMVNPGPAHLLATIRGKAPELMGATPSRFPLAPWRRDR